VPEHDDSPAAEPTNHPSESVLAAYLDGDLAADERVELEAHLEQCDLCRRALGDTVTVLDGHDTHTSENLSLAARSRPRRSRVAWLATGAVLAASIAGVAVLRFPNRPARDVESPTRDVRFDASDERIPLLAAIAPASAATDVTAHPTFIWASKGVDRYNFKVLAEDASTIWSRDVSDTTLLLPANVELEPGRSYFWRVDAMSAGIVASTRARRFTIAR
jgi:hypothetical protein